VQEQEVLKQAEVDGNTVKVFQRLEEQSGTVNTCAFYSNNLIASGSGFVSVSFMNVVMTDLLWVVTRLMWLGAGFSPQSLRLRSPPYGVSVKYLFTNFIK
jgi:hypothetical protein